MTAKVTRKNKVVKKTKKDFLDGAKKIENVVYCFTPEGKLIDPANKDKDTVYMARMNVRTGDDVKYNKQLIYNPRAEPLKGIMGWIETKCYGKLTNPDNPRIRQYHRVHIIAKNFIFKPGIKLLKKAMGRYMVKSIDDIPKHPHNNHLRMIYHCYNSALGDSFAGIPFDVKNQRPEAKAAGMKSRAQYVKWMKDTKFWSYDNRLSAMNVLVSELLEDTFDRETINYMMLRLWHELNIFYGGKVPAPGNYPTYTSRTANNFDYFKKFGEEPWNKIWEPKVKVPSEE